jgi:hypothetical protein
MLKEEVAGLCNSGTCCQTTWCHIPEDYVLITIVETLDNILHLFVKKLQALFVFFKIIFNTYSEVGDKGTRRQIFVQAS